jgi:hypothetical protein
MHTKVLPLLSFSNTHSLKELSPFPFLLQMEISDALLAILYSSNLLLSVSGCSTTLRRSLSGFFLQLQNSRSSLPVPVCTSTQCPPSRVSSYRTSSSSILSCAPYAPAQCPPGRALRILSDSNFS